MLKINRTNFDNKDFLELVRLLDQELWKKYPYEQHKYAPLNLLDAKSKIILIFSDIEAVACGAFREIENTGSVEIKRMFVHPKWRGKGISKIILSELEKWAKEENFQRAVLETGIKQLEAISLYKKSGYNIIDNYGPYLNNPNSICMSKTIEL